MPTLLMIAAVAALAGSTQAAQTTPPADSSVAPPAAVAAPAAPSPVAAPAATVAAPAAKSLNETTWTFTRKGKKIQESIDANGNYVANAGSEHVDHGTSAMVDGKMCFTSAMGKKETTCWTMVDAAIGATVETTSDKGEKLKVTRVAYVPMAPMN